MKINLIDILEEGLQLDFEEDGSIFNNILEKEKHNILIISPVNYHLSFERDKERIHVRGSIDIRLALSCSLCLSRCDKDVHWDIDYSLSPERIYSETREKRLEPEEMEVSFFEGKVIDTKDILMEQLFLESPMRTICKEDCKGLCARCGFNLNNGDCGCAKEVFVDPRLYKLKELKKN